MVSERGQVLVMVGLALAVMIGAVGLAIDGGRLYLERREAQGAADHAAITAALAFCSGSGSGTAISKGLASAAQNGYNNDGVTNTVAVTFQAGNPPKFRAVVKTMAQTAFMGILGIFTFDVAAEAVAGCVGGSSSSGPGAIYAGGTNCTNASGKPAIKVNGSIFKVYGGLHSNSDIGISGSTNQFTNGPGAPDDPVTYVGEFFNGGSGNTFQDPPYPQDVGPALPTPVWPSGWDPSDANPSLYAAYRSLAVNTSTLNDQVTMLTTNGVYYTDSSLGIDIGTISPGVSRVTLVAPNGPVKVAASTLTLGAATDADVAPGTLPRQGILILSGLTQSGLLMCDTFTVDVSGSDSTWNGIIWAPGGLIKMSGSGTATANGSLVAWAVELNGSNLKIQYDSSLFPSGGGEVLVLE